MSNLKKQFFPSTFIVLFFSFQIWSPTQKAIAPSDVLKDVMKLNEQFQGYQQQDAQELLLCILGNLDDMTQRILKLPPTEEDLKLMKEQKEEEEEEEARKTEEFEKKDKERKRLAENSKNHHERNVTVSSSLKEKSVPSGQVVLFV